MTPGDQYHLISRVQSTLCHCDNTSISGHNIYITVTCDKPNKGFLAVKIRSSFLSV